MEQDEKTKSVVFILFAYDSVETCVCKVNTFLYLLEAENEGTPKHRNFDSNLYYVQLHTKV